MLLVASSVAGNGRDADGGADGDILIDRVGGVHRRVSRSAPTSNSSTSLMVMVNIWVVTDPSLLAACTVIVRAGHRALRDRSPATVTTPVLASIVNRPSGLLVRL